VTSFAAKPWQVLQYTNLALRSCCETVAVSALCTGPGAARAIASSAICNDNVARLAGSRRISERVAQKIELSFRDLTDLCLLVVDRQLQLSHDLAQLLQGFFGFAPPTQDLRV
jgi:hypothetical protein